MPENTGRKFGKGELYQRNVVNLVEALLRLAKGDLTLDDSQLKAAVQVAWVAQDTLKVTGEYKEKTRREEKVVEGTTKQDLWHLVKKTGTPLQLPQRQRDDASTSAADRQADVVQNALYYLEDLGVLQDERPGNKRNTKYWIFTLTLKHTDASIEENLGVVKQKLGLEMSPPTDKSIDWHNICLAMLENQKRLTTNLLLSADEDMRFELDDIHVPLALVQRTKPDKRSGDVSPEEGSQLLQPTYEEKQRFRHDEFLAQVLQEGKGQSQGRRIAVIGEPGAGKTTLLQSIAFWLFEDQNQNLGLPIWISLADLQGKTLEEYLPQRWLKYALEVEDVSQQQKNALVELFKNNRVWLLLDGVDEIAGSSVEASHELPLQTIASQLKGWVAKARVVLTCRLNLWEANLNALGDDFETYRLLDFDYPLQVKEFICRWFRKTDADKGERLWAELDKSERQRIQDLVKNPLRLALLCSTWKSSDKGLPSTKAGLYQRFVEVFYTWKKNRFPTTFEQRQELNAALGRLALKAIDSEESRFRLRHRLVCEVLGDPEQEGSLFGLALQLGWLNKVGLAAESETEEKVYAFYHPTFQEYFAALAIDDWNFFLPRAHDNRNPKPVSKRYRIFEPHWKELILLWLGRSHEEVTKEQKEAFIKKLVEFEDGCGRFYWYQAYFLAAFGIAEFRECERVDEIIEHLIKWKFSAVNSENSQLRTLTIIGKEAEVALSKTHRYKVIDVLNRRLNSNQSKGNYLQLAEILLQIDPGNPLAIKVIVSYLEDSKESLKQSKIINLHRIKTIGNLKKFATGNPIAIAALDKLSLNSQQNNQTPPGFDDSLLKLPTGNLSDRRNFINLMAEIDIVNIEQAISRLNDNDIDILVGLLGRQPTLKKSINELENLKSVLEVLDRLDTNQNQLFIQRINSFAVNRLAEIACNNSAVVPTLVKILNTSEDRDILQQVTWVLGKAASRNIDATTAVVQLLQTAEEQIMALDAIYFLKTVIKSGLLTVVVKGLKDYIEDTQSYDILYEIFWHCAQNMTYPDFHQAWQEGVGNTTTPNNQSLDQPDLPQSLQSAIANDPELSQIIHLICINGSQFIDPNNPAAEIYDQMLDQNCPECDTVPKTMPALKLYWNSLKRERDKRMVLVFYTSSTHTTSVQDTAMSCPYSKTFLSDLSKFGDRVCVVTNQAFDHIRLKFFTPSQAREDVTEWIQAIAIP